MRRWLNKRTVSRLKTINYALICLTSSKWRALLSLALKETCMRILSGMTLGSLLLMFMRGKCGIEGVMR